MTAADLWGWALAVGLPRVQLLGVLTTRGAFPRRAESMTDAQRAFRPGPGA